MSLKEILARLHKRGMECGRKIAYIAESIHPNALLVVPLYRSCMVVEKGPYETCCTLHFYGDPHWLGMDLSVENLKKFHAKVIVHGQRSLPDLVFLSRDEKEYAILPVDTAFLLLKDHIPMLIEYAEK